MIKIAIVEDDLEIRSMYKSLIDDTEGMICVGEYEGSQETVNEIANSSIDVVLMDIDMPKMNGIECVKQIRKKDTNIPIVMLTVNEETELIFTALRHGSNGYLLKGLRPEKLIRGIREVLDGGAPMSSNIAKMVVDSFKLNPQKTLSSRETEVIQLLCDGDNYKTVAEKLFISSNTVKRHIRSIYTKLQVTSRGEMVQKAYRNKLVK